MMTYPLSISENEKIYENKGTPTARPQPWVARIAGCLLVTAAALVVCCGPSQATPQKPGTDETSAMRPRSGSNLVNVVGVLPVTDHSKAVEWYRKWIGRAPDVEPMEGVAEWQLAENAWIQVSVNPEYAGRTTFVVGVKDLDAQRTSLAAVGVAVGDVSDYGVVKTAEAVDPAGNKILFAQEIPQE
jgi:hypothetical protein